MKHKLFLLIGFLATSLSLSAQWVNKIVNNGIDEPYRIAYAPSSDKTSILKLEKVDTSIAFYLTGGYHCDESTTVDIGFTIGTEVKRYSLDVFTSGDRRTVFMVDDMYAAEMSDFLSDFKRCSKLSLRINESHCQSDYYTFNMTGSRWALEFISK